MTRRPQVARVRPAGDAHEVVTVTGGTGGYRRRPCSSCPWRVDQTGLFPPEAFAHSAETAYDLAGNTFGCHAAGTDRVVTCAGFLLRGAGHNLAVRVGCARGTINPAQITDGGYELHRGYSAMAVANGLHPDHPRLAPCRDHKEE